MFNNWTI